MFRRRGQPASDHRLSEYYAQTPKRLGNMIGGNPIASLRAART